jgi:L-fuconolactonase
VDLYRFDWLAGRPEDPVDPRRPIVDAHHHLWDNAGGTYLAADLQADTGAGHDVVTTVFVECGAAYDRSRPAHLAPVGETTFVTEQAAACAATGGSTIGAIVAFADMMLGDAVEEVLLAHEEAGDGLFRGIRHATAVDPAIGRSHTKPTAGMMGTPEFRAGVARLGAMGHSFDAWLFHHQLGELLTLARDRPEVVIVVDHLGAPLGVGP